MIAERVREGDPHRARQVGLGRPGEGVAHVPIPIDHQIRLAQRNRLAVAAREEHEPALAFAGVELERIHQPCQHVARGRDRVGGVAGYEGCGPEQARGVDLGHAHSGAELGHDPLERHLFEPPGQPVAELVVGRVAPHARKAGKVRVGPRVPGPGEHVGGLHHGAAVDRRDGRVVAPVTQGGFEVGPLDRVVLGPEGEVGQRRLARFRVVEDVGLVGSLVDRRATELGEPHRLASRHVTRGGVGPHAARPVPVRAPPPIADVLLAEHPVLAVGRVDDRRAGLGRAIRVARVEPVVILAALDVGGQVGLVVDRDGTSDGIGVAVGRPVAPVADWQVVVDADEVDVRVGPQRVHVEDHVVRPVAWPVRVIFRPIRRVAHPARGADDRLDLGGQVPQGLHGRIGTVARRRPQAREAHQFRADHEGVHAAGRHGKMSVVQHHGGVLREEPSDLVGRRRGPVGRPGLIGTGEAGDAAAPGERRLLGAAVRVGEAVAGRHVHHHEGVEHHADADRVAVLDRLRDRGVGRRTPESGARTALRRVVHEAGRIERVRVDLADHLGPGARDARHAPILRLDDLGPGLDLGHDAALARAQVRAEPGRDQRHRLPARQGGRELVHGAVEVGQARALVLVLGKPVPEPVGGLVFQRAQHELARARQQADGLELVGQVVGVGVGRPADDLGRDLRHAVAEGVQRHAHEQQVAGAAVGRDTAHAFNPFDEAVGLLVLGPVIERVRVLAEIEQVAVGPDAAERHQSVALAERHREG